MTEEEVLRLIRKELREVLEDANSLSRQGSSGFGTSKVDMSAGAGTPTEYLVQAVHERQRRNDPQGFTPELAIRKAARDD